MEIINCPNCGESLVFPRDSYAYCEECGWPDEDFDALILAHHAKIDQNQIVQFMVNDITITLL